MNFKSPAIYVNINHLHFKFPEFADFTLETLADNVETDDRTEK